MARHTLGWTQVSARDPDKVSFRCVSLRAEPQFPLWDEDCCMPRHCLDHACRAADVLRDVASLELVQAPGLPYIVPRDYDTYPRLTGALAAPSRSFAWPSEPSSCKAALPACTRHQRFFTRQYTLCQAHRQHCCRRAGCH